MEDEKKKLKRIEQEAWMTLAEVVTVCDAVERRTDVKQLLDARVPQGWRDWRLAISKLDRVNDAVLQSIPIKQLQQMKVYIEQNTLKFTPRHGATPLPPDMWCMKRADLATLAEYAVNTECAMCVREDSWNCPLKKVLKEMPLQLTDEGTIYCRCMTNEERIDG